MLILMVNGRVKLAGYSHKNYAFLRRAKQDETQLCDMPTQLDVLLFDDLHFYVQKTDRKNLHRYFSF
jgi:hypothetical protein